MSIKLPQMQEWGHNPGPISPAEIVSAVRAEAEYAARKFSALPEGPESCNAQNGYSRVSVSIPLSSTLFDQLMNGPTGYRAHYYAGIEAGESLNQQLIEALVPIFVESEHLYADRFDRAFCYRSLKGVFSKIWFQKAITDPSAQPYLATLEEVITAPLWREYWSNKAKLRKGLLAPVPQGCSILLNGTFVSGHNNFEQKPRRSRQVHETGWT